MKKNQKHQDAKKIGYVNSIALFIFLSLMYSVVTEGVVTELDLWVSTYISELYHPLFNTIFIFFTHLNGVWGTTIFSLIVMGCLYHKKYLHALRFYLISFVGTAVLFSALKLLIARERPHSELIDVIHFSFPSGHASMTMSIAVILYFVFVHKMKPSLLKKRLLAVCIVWPIFIAFTRVYLNVHWLSDVLAGLALGLFWVTFVHLWLSKKGSSYSISSIDENNN